MAHRRLVSSPGPSQDDSFGEEFANSPLPIATGFHDAVELDSDDEEAWDEVDVMADNSAAALAAATTGISIVISKGDKSKGKKKKADGSTTRERMIRQQRHKADATCQLALGLIRNRYLNDRLLQARLLSIVPLHLQNAFFTFSKRTHPNERDRARLFDAALKDLLSWWYQYFDIIEETGIRRRPVAEVERELVGWAAEGGEDAEASTSRFPWEELGKEDEKGNGTPKGTGKSKKGKGKGKERDWGTSEESWEVVKGVNSFVRAARAHKGSRDMSVQVFTCICRALDIPARLVFSLQPVDWRAPSAAAKTKGKKGDNKGDVGEGTTDSDGGSRRGRGTASATTLGRDSGAEGWDNGRVKLAYAVPQVNLRKSKSAKRVIHRSPSPDAHDLSRPPVFWTEAWSRYTRQWITVDPVRKKYRCKSIMEPARSTVENQLLYVVALEEDGTARDVTPRYTKSYNNYTVKARAPSKKNTDWFATLLLPYRRTFELNRDRDEQKELWDRVTNEPFPTSVGGFKNHPNYVLEQHLHRDEVIRPGAKKLGLFKAIEPVYARSSVVELKSTESYWRVGRVIKDAEIPMKWVKSRTVTINRKRAEAVAQMDGEEPTQQALYAIDQTAIYVPPPVKDGKVPRNSFGNIDLYVPSMLPEGAVHLPSKQAAKCAKTLGIDYAEAITGFEFRQRRANPIITGIVVAEEMEDALLQAILDSEEAAEEKEFAKRQDRCLKRWKKLILGLRIRQRLQASYQGNSTAGAESVEKDSQLHKQGKRPAPDAESESSTPRKRSATKLKASPPPVIAAPKPKARRTPAATPLPPIPDSKLSTSGRSLRLTLSPEKQKAATTRSSAKKLAQPPAPTPPPPPDSDSGSSLEYDSDF